MYPTLFVFALIAAWICVSFIIALVSTAIWKNYSEVRDDTDILYEGAPDWLEDIYIFSSNFFMWTLFFI